ncbi:MAG: endonuclease/exonuclease/phosphatase family protein [Bacteroidales bacterium]|nr:endonuclease/exonuclease/phosphatase family protein [Bacteroidales bacterium]
MAEKKKKRNWLSRLSFGTISLVSSGLLVLAYLSVVIDPAKAWFFTLFGLLYPVVLPLTLVLWVWSLFRKSSMRGLLTLVLLPSLFFAGRYYRFTRPEPEKEATLKVVSYNVGLFAHGPKGMDRKVLADSTSRYLRGLDADIICLQEFFLPSGMPLDYWLTQHFPGYKAEFYVKTGENGHSGNLTLSRQRVTGRGKINFENSSNLALWTDIKLDSTTLRLYNCHFESYNISIPGLVKKEPVSAVEETEQKMRRSITERPKQVSAVLQNVENAPVRSLVLGDFNDTPLSYTYFRLLRGRRDSFVKAGHGFGSTYSILWPLLRIDYILYPQELQAVSYQVEKVKYSDHYPIIATYYESGRDSQ